MARGGAAIAFQGAQFAAGAADIEAWVKGAQSGERFVYCEAPELIRGSGTARARELASDGLVTTHQHRREGGGWRFIVVRTGRAMPRTGKAATPAIDEASDIIFRAIKRAANFGQRCPSDAELARLVGPDFTRDQAQWRVRKLAVAGKIVSRQVVEDGETWRVVAVDGKSTLRPPKEAALAAALRDDERGGR